MTRFVPLLISFFAFSCVADNKDAQKNVSGDKVFKRYDYRITIDQWNGFYGDGAKFVLNNSRIHRYDSTIDASIPLGKPLTLYYIDFESKQSTKDKNLRTLIPVDTLELGFSKELSDTLFMLARNYLQSVKITNYDTLSKLKPIVTDDSHGMIELSLDGISQSVTISSINNPTLRTKQLDTLLHFINKFEPSKEN